MDFMTLDLPEPVMQGIREAGFVTATPIQEAALPLALRGKDVAGQSQTGTGKTAAFLIAAFTRMLRTPAPAPASAARRAPVVRLLGDALVAGERAHLGVHALPVSDPGRAAAEGGVARRAVAVPRGARGEVPAAARGAPARGRRPDPDLLEHA